MGRARTHARRAATPVLSERAQAAVLGLTLSGLLVGFAVVVTRELVATLGGPRAGSGDEYELFAVSLTGLVGGVFAVAIRDGARHADKPGRGSRARVRAPLGAAFACSYVVAGVLGVAVCLVRLGESTALLRSLAATFLGTSVAAASAVFGTEPEGPSRS